MTAQESILGVILWRDENWPADLEFMQSVQAACNNYGIPYIFETMVPEGEECYEAALRLIDAGCAVLISADNVHEEYLVQAAKEFPDVEFWQLNGALAAFENLDNFHNL